MVGKEEAISSVMMAPEADHVKISICPGVSATMYCSGGSLGFSHNLMTWCGDGRGIGGDRSNGKGGGIMG